MRTDGRTDKMKLMVAFRNFTNVPKILLLLLLLLLIIIIIIMVVESSSTHRQRSYNE